MPANSVKLKDYQAPGFIIEKVNLLFDIKDPEVIVTNEMTVSALSSNQPLVLHGEELTLLEISINGQNLSASDYNLTASTLTLNEVPQQFILCIKTEIKPHENTQLSGLYLSNGKYTTQCEAQGFRRITYFLDRPDVLTVYTTTIIANKNKYPVLLSNGNRVEQQQVDATRHKVTWHDPYKKPSYLFALVAGNLACVEGTFKTMSDRIIDLHFYVEHGNEAKCFHAMESLKKAMRWDEKAYGREYDLDNYMIVAVSDFNMGAMENKGLNIFNSKYVLARPDTATDNDYARIEAIIAHEYFHNWTGNRITCRDWFQLSLKEGLTVFREQEFCRDMNSRDVSRIQDVRTLRQFQFAEDAGPTAHPVRPESYIEINNFYTSTIYNKGAEVIRMQQTLLGKSGFKRGMDCYFERHDGQAVTIDDFVQCMSDANDFDFSQFQRWYSQAGTPQVDAAIRYSEEDKQLWITLTQSCRATAECTDKKDFVIPISFALFSSSGQQIPRDSDLLVLSQQQQTFCFDNVEQQPVVSLLRDFSAPINLNIDYSDDELLTLVKHETNGFARWEAMQRLAIKYLVKLVEQPDVNILTDTLLDAYRGVLADDSDLALSAELLIAPSFEDIARQLTFVDVDKVINALDLYKQHVGVKLYGEFNEVYQQLWAQHTAQMNAESYARRSLQNVCLSYLMHANAEESYDACIQQYHQATTMTEVIASLSLLMDVDCEESVQAYREFYSQWQQDDLVLDKWFTLHALSKLDNCLANVKKLTEHKAFSIKNPNKVRSLIGVFAQANYRHFHHLSGKGYAFLAEKVIELDKINPQIAARLITPLLQWRRYDAKRQDLMKKELQAMAQYQDISKDLYEMVSRSISD